MRPDGAPRGGPRRRDGQIGLNFDPGQFAPIDMDDLDAASSLRAEQLSAIKGCTTSRISVELLARLSSGDSRSGGNAFNAPRLGFEHRGLARP